MIASDATRRRRAERVRVAAEGRLEGRSTTAVSVVDLSLHGCLLGCPRALDPGAIFDLVVPLPDFQLRCKVRVAECSRDGSTPEEAPTWLAGMEFLSLPVQDLDRLRHFLDQARARRPGADPTSR